MSSADPVIHDSNNPLVSPSPSDSQDSFEHILNSSELPPPGPSHYAARRALWLKPHDNSTKAPRSLQPSTSRHKLENLLNTPDAVYNDEVWASGIQKVWKGLSAGACLKRRLPMELVVKIIHCAWIRDETWPVGAVAPEPDDVLPEQFPSTDTLFNRTSEVGLEQSSGTAITSESVARA